MPSPSSEIEKIRDLFVDAARQRKVCSVKVGDEPNARIVYPLGVCKSSKNRPIVVCWQEQGHSSQKTSTGFRNLALAECKDIWALDRKFFTPASFTPEDGQYKDWIYHVKQE